MNQELTVVKLGGSLLEDAALRGHALRAVAHAWNAGRRVVVVHGGGKRIDATLQKLGIPKQTARGLRVTDAATLDVVVSVLAGTVNKSLVAELGALGVAAVGLSGADGETLTASFHPRVDGVDLKFVGRVRKCNPTVVELLAGTGFLPVVASIAAGPAGTLLNVNADAAASALAAALGATQLVFLTDVAGVLDGDGNVIDRMTPELVDQLIGGSVVSGGMEPKLQAAKEAISRGVGRVVIAGVERHASALIEGTGGTHLVAA